jgi:hypothetical protein
MNDWTVGLHDICVLLGPDGVFDGDDLCNFFKNSRRPSPEQIFGAVLHFLQNSPYRILPDGHVKYGWEILPKVVNNDRCVVKGVEAVSRAYETVFKVLPISVNQFPNDWVDPNPPNPVPPDNGEEEPKTCWGKFMANRPLNKVQLGKFLKCWFRL